MSVAAALAFSAAGLFARAASADSWSVIFWRALFAAGFTTALVAWRGRLREEFLGMGGPGLAVAVLGASASACFVPSLRLTTVANVSLIYATSPFVAAAMAWAWYRERPAPRLLAAGAVALVGAALVLATSMRGPHVAGDLLAVAMTALYSLIAVVYRRYPATPSWGPPTLASILLLAPGAAFGAIGSASWGEMSLLGFWGLLFGLGNVAYSAGARRLPPAETSLLSALETPFGPLWVWIAFAETPSRSALAGGALILAAVVGSQWGAWRATPAHP